MTDDIAALEAKLKHVSAIALNAVGQPDRAERVADRERVKDELQAAKRRANPRKADLMATTPLNDDRFFARMDEDGTTYRKPPIDQKTRKAKNRAKQASRQPRIVVVENPDVTSGWSTPGKYTVHLQQPSWDYNRRCFVEFDRQQLIGFLETVLTELRAVNVEAADAVVYEDAMQDALARAHQRTGSVVHDTRIGPGGAIIQTIPATPLIDEDFKD